MKRRKFMIGLGATAAGGSALVGSGAFSSVKADRTIEVDTAADARAFLLLEPEGEGFRSSVSDDKLTFQLPSLEEQDEDRDVNEQHPKGLGTDSIYRFAQDAGDNDPPLFRAENRGTQSIRIFGSPEENDDKPEVNIFSTNTHELLTEENPSEEIGVGADINLGLEVDTHGLDTDKLYETSVTIHALTDDELSP